MAGNQKTTQSIVRTINTDLSAIRTSLQDVVNAVQTSAMNSTLLEFKIESDAITRCARQKRMPNAGDLLVRMALEFDDVLCLLNIWGGRNRFDYLVEIYNPQKRRYYSHASEVINLRKQDLRKPENWCVERVKSGKCYTLSGYLMNDFYLLAVERLQSRIGEERRIRKAARPARVRGNASAEASAAPEA